MAVQPIEFQTPRLKLRVWRGDDLTPFAEMNSDPEVMRFFPSTQGLEQSKASISTWLCQFEARGWSNWAVELKASGEFVGFIGLTIPRRQLPFSPYVEVGWRLKRAAWGLGYATEGAIASLRVGFEQLDLNEIVSFTAVKNLQSVAVMRRIGMFNANADFEHPAVPEGHPLRTHCLYKVSKAQWQQRDA